MSFISRVPSAVITECIFPFLTLKNDLRLNATIEREGREFTRLSTVCRKLNLCAKAHVAKLKTEREANIKEFYRLKPAREIYPPMLHMAVVSENLPQFLAYLRNGADINEENRAKMTVSALAIKLKRAAFLPIIAAHPEATHIVNKLA